MRPPASCLALALASLLGLAACGNPVEDDHFANKAEPAPAPPAPAPVRHVVPVRIGELGVNFDACAAAGTTRRISGEQRLGVREGPFDTAREVGAIGAGSRFFICSRSHDQKWLGVVFDEAGSLAANCGVSMPVEKRRDYAGPCRSGWVSSAFVRLIAGVEQPAGGATMTNQPPPDR